MYSYLFFQNKIIRIRIRMITIIFIFSTNYYRILETCLHGDPALIISLWILFEVYAMELRDVLVSSMVQEHLILLLNLLDHLMNRFNDLHRHQLSCNRNIVVIRMIQASYGDGLGHCININI